MPSLPEYRKMIFVIHSYATTPSISADVKGVNVVEN